MPPKKGTKAYNSEYVYVYYGINMNTLLVESVWQQRDGTLSKGHYSHHTMPGRSAQAEVTIVFNLTDVQMLPIQLLDGSGSAMKQQLEEKAAQMRAAKEAEQQAAKESGDTGKT